MFRNNCKVYKFVATCLLAIWVISEVFLLAAVATKDADVAEVTLTDQKVILSNTALMFPELNYKPMYSITSNSSFLTKVQSSIDKLEAALSTDAYTAEARTAMEHEFDRLTKIETTIKTDITKLASWEDSHYYAAKTWEFFLAHGYSEVVTSAIIGNMMIETSGGTLDLNPSAYDSSNEFYGLCQWSIRNRPKVVDMSFEEQLLYLHTDMSSQFKIFGSLYKEDFGYEDFLAMTDPAEAAYAFAKVYERCASWSCGLRRPTAVQAYNYFNLNS